MTALSLTHLHLALPSIPPAPRQPSLKQQLLLLYHLLGLFSPCPVLHRTSPPVYYHQLRLLAHHHYPHSRLPVLHSVFILLLQCLHPWAPLQLGHVGAEQSIQPCLRGIDLLLMTALSPILVQRAPTYQYLYLLSIYPTHCHLPHPQFTCYLFQLLLLQSPLLTTYSTQISSPLISICITHLVV